MAVPNVTVPLDEALVRRARLGSASGADVLDEQVVEYAWGIEALEVAAASRREDPTGVAQAMQI